ncbi:MAG: helix-turn-helix domain-containing protein [Deltaproteobacteria bacterium]|nr:helix-turn-helix domain-containing protein [Deltaproteobacteria bacterium]
MGVNYSDLIERMRWAGKLKNDSAVARTLGVTPQALSNYKKRGEMPTDLVLRFAKIYGLSVDWLITGQGEMRKAEAEKKGYPGAAEETPAYGKEGGQRRVDLAALSPDEIIYVGKLLKILRSPNKGTAASLKHTVDAFLKAAEMPPEAGASAEREKEKKD